MVEAEIKTTSGAIISVKGTTAEVNEILDFWQRREDYFKRRRFYFRHFEDDRNRKAHEKTMPFFNTKKTISSPRARVIELIKDGFFNDYRTLPEIREKIQKQYELYIANASLHPTLMLLIGQGKLEREKQKNGLWGYKEVKEEGKNGKT